MAMRKSTVMGVGLLAVLLAARPVAAQAPPAAGGAGAASSAANGGAAAGAAPGAAAAAPGFFKKCCMALDECRRKCCATPAGQMINSMTAPLSSFTGGIIPPFCPLMPSAADLAKPGVEGAASMAKKDALEAKARREAVRYLGTLDCRYYPEAEAALIAALRTDRIECVRLEAATGFANGCCCTKRVLEALEICVSGSERDGMPAERSYRVRDMAMIALDRCLACFHETIVEEEKKEKEREKELPIPKEVPKDIPPKITKADRELYERARQTLENYQPHFEVAQPAQLPKGQRSLFHILRYSAEGSPTTPAPVMMASSRTVMPMQTSQPEPVTAKRSQPQGRAELRPYNLVAAPASKEPPTPQAMVVREPDPIDMPPQPVEKAPAEPKQKPSPVPPTIVIREPEPTDPPPVKVVPPPMPEKLHAPEPVKKEAPIRPASLTPAPEPREVPSLKKVTPPIVEIPRLAEPVKTEAPAPPKIVIREPEPQDLPPLKVVTPRSIEAYPDEPLKVVTPHVNEQQPPLKVVTPHVNEQQPAAITPPVVPQPLKVAPEIGPGADSENAVKKLVDVALTGSTPGERQYAIAEFGKFDWTKNPPIVACLVKAARLDSDRNVRLDAIRQLAAMKVDLPYACDHLKYLTKDSDGRVSDEAKTALKKLGR
jgi:hypothetical protein